MNQSVSNTYRVNTILDVMKVPLVGDTSAAVWSQASAADYQALPTTPFADNKEFETDGDSILDFSEANPFGDVT